MVLVKWYDITAKIPTVTMTSNYWITKATRVVNPKMKPNLYEFHSSLKHKTVFACGF